MFNKKTSLIAEADFIIASEIKMYLSSLNFQVYPVISKGEELIEAALSVHPALIITDINLDGQLDGVEAIARMEEILKIPYIFITAYDDYSRLITSYYLNPLSLIKKPIDQNNLVKSLSIFEAALV